MAANNGNRARVIELLLQGLPHSVIAAKTGSTINAISFYVGWAKKNGYPLPDRRRGKPRAVISRLPAEVRRWLADQRPEGAEIEDLICAIVVDAYHEETGK